MAANEAGQFGRYELVSKLAAGGMAVTYRARMNGAAGVTKPVVIKQILPHFADDPGFVEMFVSEARVAAGLTHGNIAQVFDFGEIDGQFFLAMEFVHGQPLSKLIRRAQRTGLPSLPLPLALHIAIQMCDGLDYAHRHVGEDGQPMGLVHRDVSPDNVLISYEGQVKVIDFGIAKATSVVEARTSPGTLKGKYPYFSTEQARGQHDLDARSDIFAVGVVLYEMVCGRRPYEGELVAVLPRILSGDYAPPSALNPAITPELESVMATAMALDRDTRYPTAQAFSEALREQLYSANARFSPAMLSQLMGHLFSEELAAEGRRVEVPPGFLEQLAAWQAQAQPTGEPTGIQPRQPGTGGGRPGAQRPPSNGSGGRPSSNASGRSVSSASVRRVTSGAVPRTPAPATLAAPPGLAAEPSTAVSEPVTATRDSVEGPHDTPVDMPAVTVPARLDPLSTYREAQERDSQERADRRQRLVMLISLPLIGLALFLGAINYFLSRSAGPPTGSLWLTSTPIGATVKLNGKDVPGVTPLVVEGVLLDEANTLVLTLPGYRPWTKRFTLSSEADPPIHAELERVQAEPAAPEKEKPQPTEAVAASTATPGDAGVEAVTDTAPEAPKPKPYNEVDYPARLFVLRPRHNAFPVTKYTTASIDLSPSASYSANTEGSASLDEGRGGGSGTLAYFLEGDNLSADESFGLIGPSSRTIKGARRMHVFLLDDDVSDNSGTVRVHLRQSKWMAPRQLTFNAAQDALVLEPLHQLVLRGLNPDALYLLTVRDDVPELRSGAGGRTRRVLCVESSQQSARRTHRLLESGKRYQLTGADTLRCTFPDTQVEDNAGALEVDIVDVTVMSRRDRAAALRGASR
ncbi:serine/threonine-protein kinase [Archangium lipolyticum]|uniref:serine/threonine-protein kinase n=1 Tax=Archangium lipolyticum TaxID=2970465 RepID=UPI00214A4575|nr:serine/threonine-protein kinase [Archangium lipolyticum]